MVRFLREKNFFPGPFQPSRGAIPHGKHKLEELLKKRVVAGHISRPREKFAENAEREENNAPPSG